jgi:hypothetical protein
MKHKSQKAAFIGYYYPRLATLCSPAFQKKDVIAGLRAKASSVFFLPDARARF